MTQEKDQSKTDIRRKTSWAEVNDTRGRVDVEDPNKGPKSKRK